MSYLYIPLLLLNLTKQEEQLLIMLYLIEQNINKHTPKKYTIEEIGKLSGHERIGVEDLLNKLMIRNIIGRITYGSVIKDTIKENFDEDFLTIIYNKQEPFKSAIGSAGFYIDDGDTIYVFNPVIKSWKYKPKALVVSKLKKLQKIMDNDFVNYLLKSFNNGEKNDKRKQSNLRLNGWNILECMNVFMRKYKVRYGVDYIMNSDKREQGHMKNLLLEFSKNRIPKSELDPFFNYAFDEALNRDYVLKIVGLKYYANEYLKKITR